VDPVVDEEGRGGVRRALERVVAARPGAALDLRDLGADGDSLSVGSTISVPGTGKLSVGAWKP
jgi:hypothetical protein